MDVVRLPIVCGPTGAGKSRLALALAEASGSTIVSADSRQIYRRFDIGTAKPSVEEQARIPHACIDIVEPGERYSAARWVHHASAAIDRCLDARIPPVVVGGTGFYLRALVAPLFAEPSLDPAQRQALARDLDRLSTEELRRKCRDVDPARAHLGRTQLLRAIEVALLSGERISTLHVYAARDARYSARYLLVDPGPVLADLIAARVDAMLAHGWIDEVRHLVRDIPPDAPAWNATGYGLIRQVVTGALGLTEARERIIIATRQYAKRQRTWFRHQLPAHDVVRVNSAAPDALDVALAWWREEEQA
ncbi:MAG: tRNA (adenosine(37)-N6)-dimethylallyltransferase MiaA [Gemmatimonadaceae bacterium]